MNKSKPHHLLFILSVCLITFSSIGLQSYSFGWGKKSEHIIKVGQLNEARFNHTATLLNDGSVLITGGDNTFPSQTAEIFDPKTKTFSPTSDMNSRRREHKAIKLKDGRVLLYGGNGIHIKTRRLFNKFIPNDDIELYDPVSQSFSVVEKSPVHIDIAIPTESGLVFLRGYKKERNNNIGRNISYLYNPTDNTFQYLGEIKFDECLNGFEMEKNKIFLFNCKRSDSPPRYAEYKYHFSDPISGFELIDIEHFDKSQFYPVDNTQSPYTQGEKLDNAHFVLFDHTPKVYLFRSDLSNLNTPIVHQLTNINRFDTKHQHKGREHFYTAHTLLNNGEIIVWGGVSKLPKRFIRLNAFVDNSIEIMNPLSGDIKNIGEPSDYREYGQTITTLKDGSVLVTGGIYTVKKKGKYLLVPMKSAELFIEVKHK